MATDRSVAPLFLLDKENVVLVKPSKPTPSEVLSLSTIDNHDVFELLCQTIYVYRSPDHIISSNGNCHGHDPTPKLNPQLDPATVIKESLSKALFYYYPLAGKLKRHADGMLRINCINAHGVPFLAASANCDLSSLRYLDGIDVEIAKKFVFDAPEESDDDGYHPLVVQVTKFSCGGFTVGMGLSHSVCDGFGAAQFFRAMAELASGKSEPSVKPVWERERLVGTPIHGPLQFPVDKATSATSPYLPTADILHECFYVNADTIQKLKTSLVKQISGNEILKESFTTLEVLGAYVWRSKFRALKLHPEGKTNFSMAVGIRRLWYPPLPEGYYGNAFVSSSAVLLGRDLDQEPLSAVARLLKQSKKSASLPDSIENSLGMLETVRQQNIKIEVASSGGCMVFTDWRQVGLFEEVDFGWKAFVNMIPVPWKMFGAVDMCIFLPPCSLDASMKGGVRILVSLPREAMPKFREEMDALKLSDDNGLIGLK